jgi:WhiB family redox-sensing transcriptional regulator
MTKDTARTPTKLPDPRFPSPLDRASSALACREDPKLFDPRPGAPRAEKEQATAAAKKLCSRCPRAKVCLLWALANPELAGAGVWAATTLMQRRLLARRIEKRLGKNWRDVPASKRPAQNNAVGAIPAASTPTTELPSSQGPSHTTLLRERDGDFSRLEAERIPTRPTPYVPPERRPLTPSQAAANRALLEAALRKPSAA